jgi:hypothetical protein
MMKEKRTPPANAKPPALAMNADDSVDACMAVFDRRTLHLQSSIGDITALLGIKVA